MTSCTILSGGCLMNIGMAFAAFSFCIGKYKCGVARFTADNIMLSGKWQLSRVVIERIDLFINGPPFWAVADTAAQPEILSVRMFHFLPYKEKNATKQY